MTMVCSNDTQAEQALQQSLLLRPVTNKDNTPKHV